MGWLFGFSFGNDADCHVFSGFDCNVVGDKGLICLPMVIDCDLGTTTSKYELINIEDKGSFSLFTSFSLFRRFYERFEAFYNGKSFDSEALIKSCIVSGSRSPKEVEIDDIRKYLSDGSTCCPSPRKKPKVEYSGVLSKRHLSLHLPELVDILSVKKDKLYSSIQNKYGSEFSCVWEAVYIEKKVQECADLRLYNNKPIDREDIVTLRAYLESMVGYPRVLELKQESSFVQMNESNTVIVVSRFILIMGKSF